MANSKLPENQRSNKEKEVKQQALTVPAGIQKSKTPPSKPNSGAKPWKTMTKRLGGSALGDISKYNREKKFFFQSVHIKEQEAFIVKPLILTSGPLKGRRVLLLEDPPKFNFMGLPTEVRLMVYDILFEDEPTRINESYRTGKKSPVMRRYRDEKNREQPTNAGILQVDRKLFREVAPIFYGKAFVFSGISQMGLLLGEIGSMSKYIKHVRLSDTEWWHRGCRPTAIRALAGMTGLKTLALSHWTFCNTVLPTRDNLSMEKFVEAVRVPLAKLHRAHKDKRSDINVLDIIQIGPHYVCYSCQNKLHENCFGLRSDCKTSCKDFEAHNAELTAQLRSLLAKALKIKE